MADQDDIQLRVGIDLDALKTSAEKAAEVLGKSISGAMASALGGQILGSGLPPTAITAAPASGSGSAQMQDTLDEILEALNLGFSRLDETVAKTAQPSPGLTDDGEARARRRHGPLERGVESVAEAHGRFTGNRALGYLSSVGQSAGAASQSIARAMDLGGEVETFRTLSTLADMIPGMGGFSSAFSALAESAAKEDKLKELRYQAWRDLGNYGAAMFYDPWETERGGESAGVGMGSWERSPWYQLGIGPEESLQYMRRGVRATGNIGTGLMAGGIETYYGMGNEALGLFGAMRRGGAGVSEQEAFGEAIGVAIATNLERGRWGESVEQMTRAAQSVMHGNVDLQRIVALQTFIGRMGPQYQGDTASARSMEESLKGLSTGSAGGVSNIFALRAAGLGTGVSYAEARMRMELGAGAQGGQDIAAVLKQYVNYEVVKKALMSSDRESLVQASMFLNQIVNVGMPTWFNILRTLRQGIEPGRGISDEKLQEIIESFTGAPLPDVNLEPRRRRIREERPSDLDFSNDRAQGGIGEDIGPERKYRTREEAAAYNAAQDAATAKIRAAGRGAVISYQWNTSGLPSSVDPALLKGYGEDVKRGSTALQREAAKHEAAYETKYDWERLVHSEEEAEAQWATKPAHGMFDVRAYGSSGEDLPKGKHRIHASRDVYMPPGSPVYTPVAGTWVRSLDLRGQGSTYGYGGVLRGDDGVEYKFVHLETQPTLSAGTSYPAGTFIGNTVRHKIGRKGSRSHLHLEARRGGKMVDPYRKESGEIDLEKVNRLYTGVSSYEEYKKREAASSPVTAPPDDAPVAPSDVPASMPDGGVPGVTGGPVSSVSPQKVEIVVAIRDDRVSVQEVAGRARRTGPRGVRVTTG